MGKSIKWSIHRDDKKIGTVEKFDDEHAADRYVDTGMATYVDDVEPESEPASGDTEKVEPVPAETDSAPTTPDVATDEPVTDAGKATAGTAPTGPNSTSKTGQAADGKSAPAPAPKATRASGS